MRSASSTSTPTARCVVRRSTFTGGRCSNGAALSSIGVSWRITSSTFTDNRAVGRGANPQRAGTPGGGSGGAIYLDGNAIHLRIEDSTMTGNHAREGGGAIFFVSNDRTGTLTIDGSQLTDNPSEGFETLPGIFFLGASRTITDSRRALRSAAARASARPDRPAPPATGPPAPRTARARRR